MTFETLTSAALTDAPDDLLRTMETRRSVSAARLGEPGPNAQELRRLLAVAARVPDHGALAPWRFIVVEGAARRQLVQRLQDACRTGAGDEAQAVAQAEQTAQKLERLFGQPPLVVIVVSRPDPGAKIPVFEQTLSVGAACMNLMTAATALGYASNWLTGWTASHPAARPIIGLEPEETVAGIIPIGTAMDALSDRPRPDLAKIVRSWIA